MKTIKLIACDIDGVLLEDTFSPILRLLANKYKVPYTAELENNTFSQKRDEAAAYLKNYLRLPEKTSNQEMLNEYFEERNKFLQEKNNSIISGVPEFLEILKTLGIELVCYGGLEKQMIDLQFQPYLKYFNRYICTNSFRPGLKEIIQGHGLKFSEVLVIDDVNRVAEEAKKYKIPFIGVSSQDSWGFQEEQMKNTGVKYLVHSVKEITKDYFEKIDIDKSVW